MVQAHKSLIKVFNLIFKRFQSFSAVKYFNITGTLLNLAETISWLKDIIQENLFPFVIEFLILLPGKTAKF